MWGGGGIFLALMCGYVGEAKGFDHCLRSLTHDNPSPSLFLFLSLHSSLAAFTCTMSTQPSETPVDRSDLSAERFDREGWVQQRGTEGRTRTKRLSGIIGVGSTRVIMQ